MKKRQGKYLAGIEGDGIGTHAVLRAACVDDLRGRSHHRHVGDLVGAAGAGIRAEELQVAGLSGHVDDRSPAEALADLGVGSRPEQLEIIVVDLLVARRHAAAVLPAFALRGVGADDEGGTVENVLLYAPGRNKDGGAIPSELYFSFSRNGKKNLANNKESMWYSTGNTRRIPKQWRV